MSTRRRTTNFQKLNYDSMISMEGEIFRSYYCFGDFVLLAFRKEIYGAPDVPPEYDYRVGRIDCVRLNKCPEQNQPKFPGTDERIDDYETMWPIYFYHDGSREWIKMKQIVYRFEAPEFIKDIEKSYNHSLFQKRVPNWQQVKDDELFQEGLASMKKSLHQDFQFNCLHEGASEDFTNWFNGDDSVKMLCKWEDMGKAKKIIELNSRGSNLVVDDPNFLNDPIQLMHGRAIHQLFNKNPIEVDDFIGAVYTDVKYIGRVTDKDDEKILVQFYRERKEGWEEDRNPPKKQRRSSNNLRSPRGAAKTQKAIKFKPKAKDTDWITEQRQGYIFAHFKKDQVVVDNKKNILDILVGKENPQDHIENLMADWDLWAASMTVKVEPRDVY